MPPSAPSPSAETLLALMQSGDLLALDQLAREWGARLLAVARRQCHQPGDAEDAVQQALLVATTAMTGIRSEGSALAWLSTLVARSCQRMNRRAALDAPLADAPCHCDDPEVVAERRELAAKLSAALMSLSRLDRLLFLLSAEGFNGVELAERFDLSHDAVRGRLKRARQALKAALESADTLALLGGTSGANRSPGAAHDDDDLFDSLLPAASGHR